MPALNTLISSHGEKLRFRVLFDQAFFDTLQTDKKTFDQWVPYPRYLDIMRECDISLLPLEPTRFNTMKSDLKFLESAGCGAVSLASPTVYGHSIEDNLTGLIYHSVDEFFGKLKALIENQQWRYKLADAAYSWVKNNRMLSQSSDLRIQWYLDRCKQLERLNRALYRDNPALFE